MSISVYTIKYINRNTSGNLNVHGLLTGKESASTSISTIDYTNQSINPSTVATLSVIDDVIRLS